MLLTAGEIKEAGDDWIRDGQRELEQQPNYETLKQQLGVYEDAEYILRCGGRLSHAHCEKKQDIQRYYHETLLFPLSDHGTRKSIMVAEKKHRQNFEVSSWYQKDDSSCERSYISVLRVKEYTSFATRPPSRNNTLVKAIDICRAAEETKKQSEQKLSKIPQNQIEQLRHRRGIEIQQYRSKQSEREKRGNQRKDCRYCSSQHDKGHCPAFGKVCKKYEKRNHFAKVCLSKKVDEINAPSSSHSSDESTDSFVIGSVQNGKKTTNCQTQEEIKQYKVETCGKQDKQKAWTASIDKSGLDVEYKLDTRAQAIVIPQSLYKRLPRKPRLRQTKGKLFAYDGLEIAVAGKCIIRIKPKGRKDYPVQFFVVPIKSSPILGLEMTWNVLKCRQATFNNHVTTFRKSTQIYLEKLDACLESIISIWHQKLFLVKYHTCWKKSSRPSLIAWNETKLATRQMNQQIG